MIKRKLCYIAFLGVIIIALVICLSSSNNVLVSANATALSNKSIGWGIKRVKDNKQPELGTENKNLIDKYNGIAMGNSTDKYVYLTFDMGYEAGYTEKILEVLKTNNIKACFFITAHYLNSQTQLVQKMVNEGHIIGNHTVNHKSLPTISDESVKEEITKLHTSVYEKTGFEMKYARPPKGEYSERVLSLTNSLGYTTVMWSMAYDDWEESKQGREEYAKSKIIENIHPGAVILLHATSKDNANVLDYCIKEIKSMGYEFKSLDEFV